MELGKTTVGKRSGKRKLAQARLLGGPRPDYGGKHGYLGHFFPLGPTCGKRGVDVEGAVEKAAS